jgi:hypothetical protein
MASVAFVVPRTLILPEDSGSFSLTMTTVAVLVDIHVANVYAVCCVGTVTMSLVSRWIIQKYCVPQRITSSSYQDSNLICLLPKQARLPLRYSRLRNVSDLIGRSTLYCFTTKLYPPKRMIGFEPMIVPYKGSNSCPAHLTFHKNYQRSERNKVYLFSPIERSNFASSHLVAPSEWQDSNLRPLPSEGSTLPSCATPSYPM